MATHAIGNFRFNLPGEGLLSRFASRKRDAEDMDYMDENPELEAGQAFDDDDPGFDDEAGYDDGYVPEDDYDPEDEGFDPDDDGYGPDDDGTYPEDDGYGPDDDGYYPEDDDGYGPDDDGYYPEDDDGYGPDDDGYYPEDDDGYGPDDDGYYPEDDGYGDGYYGSGNPVMRYIDDNDWVTYLLLFLFPPLGVYLLWRRARFDKPVRMAISAASLIWFVVALILLFSALFGGGGDVRQQPNITLAPVTPTPEATVAADDTDVTGTGIGTGTGTGATDESASAVAPAATPITSGTSSSQYVYSPATGLYYHNSDTCSNIPEGVTVSRVLKDVAENNRRQSPCPVCIGTGDSTVYYGTRGGKYYHLDSTCSSMKNPITYSKEAAEKEGKTPCPVCVTKTQVSLSNNSVKFVSDKTTDKSGMTVYATKKGTYFHVRSDCSGMKGAKAGSLKAALLSGKKACPTCCPAAGTTVYMTANGKSYHLDPNCQGMKGATTVTLAEAMVVGKSRCKVCIKSSLGSFSTSSASATSGQTAINTASASTTSEVYVYATKTGSYYHTKKNCSGMKGATQVTLKSMIAAKRKACPVCADNANTVVYATKNGTYYHSFAGCSGMRNASTGTQAQAIAAGYKRCPNCWSTTTSSSGAAASGDGSGNGSGTTTVAVSRSATAKNTYVYATRNGSYYHSKSNCSGMKNPSRVTLATAIKAGKKACPTCASAANRYVYSTADGKYYHAASVCKATGMRNATRRTLASALMLNQTACPKCITANSGSSLNKGTTKLSTTDAAAVSSAQKAKQQAAQQAAQSAAAKAKAAAEAKAKAAAKAKYLAALKKLARRKVASFKSGTSGVKVYVTVDGRTYHLKNGCSGIKYARKVSLETAMNYGYSACKTCCSKASRKVYATKGGKYYHYNKTDAGVGAVKGSLSVALACGYKACPYCVTKSKSLKKVSNYTPGKSGIRVYSTHSNKYYHAKANCGGMKNASRITLETAMNYGKKPCPTCLSVASRKVYAAKGEKYYHRYKSHAGSNAVAGTLAAAKAIGLKACPNCVVVNAGSKSAGNGGTQGAPVSKVQYSAPGSTGVYINAATVNNYYHKAASCSKAKFSGGTKVTLKYVLDWGYKACPYCQPPTKTD